MTARNRVLKRIFDFSFSALGLLVLWPVLLICIVVARKSSGGSGIFKQARVGRNGKLFQVYKIRTMFAHGQTQGSTITVANDNRMTRSGKFMRKYKLDELPQLVNIVLNQMSFVGPRPDVPGYADVLSGADRRVLELLPGITGPASIKYVNEEEILHGRQNPEKYNDEVIYPDKVRINLDYLENYSLYKDILYILMTLKLVQVSPALRFADTA